jgi:hypothetical protein
MKRIMLFTLLFVGLLIGCRKKEPSSAIVQKLEAAGAGNLSVASVNSIQQWLQQRQELALQVKKDCDQVRKSGSTPANWGDTTEGRVCTAAANTSLYQPFKGDNKTY